MPNAPNYSKICFDLLKNIPSTRTREVISRRFGLEKGKTETLESIGQNYNITRERVRQIEDDGLLRVREKTGQHKKTFNHLISYLEDYGGLKREDLLASQLDKGKLQYHVLFLLTLDKRFARFAETKDFYPFWAISPQVINSARKIINPLVQKIEERKKPLSLAELYKISPTKKTLSAKAFSSFIEISKEIEEGLENLYGLKNWPEVSPRGLKDKAFLALKKEGKPLHFRDIALAIDKLNFAGNFDSKKKALSQTVHNELIKDSRFILVGRGVYALADWGYEKGYVKDVISRVLKEKKKPLHKEEVIKEVLKQRFVKSSTILLNLQNKKYFIRDPDNKYTFRID